MEIYTNEELFRLWHESRKWERLWKQAAKKWWNNADNWRVSYLSALESWKDALEDRDNALATATRRLGLLSTILYTLSFCPICEEFELGLDPIDSSVRTPHADDCELARELEE
jgi:hypothetical protein